MDNYTLEISKKLYDRIINGKTAFVVWINDKVRQSYKAGNMLSFVCNEEQGLKEIRVTILQLLYFTETKDLVNMLGKNEIGYKPSVTIDEIEDQLNFLHKYDKIDKYGLVAIDFSINEN